MTNNPVFISFIEFFIFWLVVIIRGWLYYKQKDTTISLSTYLKRLVALDLGIMQSLFYLRIVKNNILLNSLTIMVGLLFCNP